MNWERYRAVVAEFDLIFGYANQISDALIGKTPPTPQHSYAAEIFVKLLAHCVTLRTISPDPDRQKEKELWELPSAAAISRCVIESFDAMAYVAAQLASEEEKQFRLLLWELHDANRRTRMLEAIGTSDERYVSLVAKEQKLHTCVLAHPYFEKIPKKHQRSIRDRDPPESYVSMKDQCTANRVDHAYYTAVIMHMSHFVHTHPFAVHQLFGFKGGSAEALGLMSLPLQYAMAFLSRSIAEWRALFPELAPKPSAEIDRKIRLWNILVERGTKSAAEPLT